MENGHHPLIWKYFSGNGTQLGSRNNFDYLLWWGVVLTIKNKFSRLFWVCVCATWKCDRLKGIQKPNIWHAMYVTIDLLVMRTHATNSSMSMFNIKSMKVYFAFNMLLEMDECSKDDHIHFLMYNIRQKHVYFKWFFFCVTHANNFWILQKEHVMMLKEKRNKCMRVCLFLGCIPSKATTWTSKSMAVYLFLGCIPSYATTWTSKIGNLGTKTIIWIVRMNLSHHIRVLDQVEIKSRASPHVVDLS